MPVSFIPHKGHRILFIDYSSIKKKEEMIANLHEAVRMFREANDKLRVFIDVTDAAASREWMDESKKYGKELDAQTLRSAIIGVEGLKKILLQGYNAVTGGRLIPFDSKEKALDYLVEQ